MKQSFRQLECPPSRVPGEKKIRFKGNKSLVFITHQGTSYGTGKAYLLGPATFASLLLTGLLNLFVNPVLRY